MGVLIIGALPLVSISGPPDFWKLPKEVMAPSESGSQKLMRGPNTEIPTVHQPCAGLQNEITY